MRILFFGDNPAVFWRYQRLVALLEDRGHTVDVVFKDASPRRRRFDGWRPVARIVRLLADLARYSEPRFADAELLRARQARILESGLQRHPQEPIGKLVARRVARRLAPGDDWPFAARVIEQAARLEEAIPTSGVVDRFIRGRAPDAVLVTPGVKAPEQLEYFKSARGLGVPAGACIRSWDHLTNKGLLKWAPERVFVWNEAQRREAVELHGVPAERVVATGAQVFDEWFERQPSCSRDAFTTKVGLDPARPYVLFLGSTPFVASREVEFVHEWLTALRASHDVALRDVGVLVRPHPNRGSAALWDAVDLSAFGNAVVWPRGKKRAVDDEARAGLFDSVSYSAAVVGVNTTAMIEAAIAGRNVLTILNREFAQEGTLHFQHLLEENGGFLFVASTLPEHLEQLSHALSDDPEAARRRREFVESFVRPRGLERPATDVLADAVEELASVPVEEPARGNAGLRLLLAVEALLDSLAIAVDAPLAAVRKARRRPLAPPALRAAVRILSRT